MRRAAWIAVVALTVGFVAPTGAAASTSTATATAAAGVISVPRDAPTIQAAVDEAKPGTLVLVAPGVYQEAVTVSPGHHDIVIRGESRARTVVDCGFAADGDHLNGFKVLAAGVAIEHLTARDCKSNGFLWQGVKGLPGLVPHRGPQRRLRALRVRVDGRAVGSRLRRGQPRRGLLHRPVLPVPRGDHRRRVAVERLGVLGDELGR